MIFGNTLYFKAMRDYFALKKEIKKERFKFFNLNRKQKKLQLNRVINKIKSLD
jgi:hypothetical protein